MTDFSKIHPGGERSGDDTAATVWLGPVVGDENRKLVGNFRVSAVTIAVPIGGWSSQTFTALDGVL